VTGRGGGVEAEKEVLILGEEHELPSGLIWVAMSLLETAGDTLVPASLKASNFSSVNWNQHEKEKKKLYRVHKRIVQNHTILT
jgi:hypothetical protein